MTHRAYEQLKAMHAAAEALNVYLSMFDVQDERGIENVLSVAAYKKDQIAKVYKVECVFTGDTPVMNDY